MVIVKGIHEWKSLKFKTNGKKRFLLFTISDNWGNTNEARIKDKKLNSKFRWVKQNALDRINYVENIYRKVSHISNGRIMFSAHCTVYICKKTNIKKQEREVLLSMNYSWWNSNTL